MKRLTFLALLASLAFVPVSALAQSVDQLTQRMRNRLAQIDPMKSQGLVGEDNRGFLSARGNLSAAQRQVLNAENADRRKIYTALASKHGVSSAQIGSQRAAQNRQRAAKGVWIQNANGQWAKK